MIKAIFYYSDGGKETVEAKDMDELNFMVFTSGDHLVRVKIL